MIVRSTKQAISELAIKALEHVESVSYKVSARWLFYRLLQDGFYKQKNDYKKFIQLLSKWRHGNFEGWKPDTLADETRESILQGVNKSTSFEDMAEDITYNLSLWTLDSHFKYQDFYIEVWYEAKAMTGQFQKYSPYTVLCPFGGFTSIPMKWEIAKRLERMYARFKKPIKILYFGDYDDAGFEILNSSVESDKGLKKWCSIDFKVARCGLTIKQAKKYKIPENPEKPNQYQWEALNDEQAREIIESNINRYINFEAINRVKLESDILNEKISFAINKAFDEITSL